MDHYTVSCFKVSQQSSCWCCSQITHVDTSQWDCFHLVFSFLNVNVKIFIYSLLIFICISISWYFLSVPAVVGSFCGASDFLAKPRKLIVWWRRLPPGTANAIPASSSPQVPPHTHTHCSRYMSQTQSDSPGQIPRASQTTSASDQCFWLSVFPD